MKRKLLALTLAFLLALTACTPSGQADTPEEKTDTPISSEGQKNPLVSLLGNKVSPAAKPDYPKGISFDDYEGKREIWAKYPLSDELEESVGAFSARAASLALGGTEENALFSPVSLWFALALCAESARGETRTALLDALGLTEEVGQSAKILYNNLYKKNKIGELKLSTSLWVNGAFPVNQDFLDQAAQEFYAHSYLCDFSAPATGKAMGDWLDEATGGLLGGQALETDPETLMTLFSAIYYSDQWIDEFNEDKNTTGDFHNIDGTVSQAEYMNRTYGSHGYWSGDGYLFTTLSLKNGGAMYLILPDEGMTPGDLLADTDTLAEILSGGAERGHGEVIVQVPKFEISDSLDLKPVLNGLGAGIVFDGEKADFSNLSQAALGLSGVKQEATLSIDEKGVTAAAFTQIDYAGAALPEGRAELILDRPFLFAVVTSGVPLFVGAVNEM